MSQFSCINQHEQMSKRTILSPFVVHATMVTLGSCWAWPPISPPLYITLSHTSMVTNYQTGMCCLERVQEGGITKDQLLLWEIEKHLCLNLES